ncbi:MAG: DevR family CRISPR-associated autoregulator [Pirellulales bacterium]
MGTHYLYGTILTGEAVAANNRGDNIGNTTTLQKVFHQDDLHTSVSAEAIRFALRYRFQLQDRASVNRSYDPVSGRLDLRDEKREYWADVLSEKKLPWIDDDLMGFMDAAAAKQESEEETTEEMEPEERQAKKKKAKGKTTKRPSPLALGRAVSLRPYRGEISFNCVSGAKEKGSLSLYAAEMHTTEYQYSFGLNLNDVLVKAHVGELIEAIIDPPPVAGNHARFAFDFSPASIVLRVTSAHSSKIQNCFEHDEENRTFTAKRLIQRVRSGDVPASELIIGGELSATVEGASLKELGVTTDLGVAAAAKEARRRLAKLGAEFESVATKTKEAS